MSKRTFLSVTLAALSLMSALPASAEGLGTPVRAEIIEGWQRSDGTRVAAIRFRLAPGWKTYWRAPGDAGIPPQFDWSGSQNLRGVGLTWPAPTVFEEGGLRTIGYKDELVLPITVAPLRGGAPVSLNATLDIGVCSDICVPQQLRLSATLDDASTRPVPAIAAALAARAYTGAEAGLRAATCTLRPTESGLQLETRLTLPATGGEEVVVIEPGPGLWAGATDTRRKGGDLVATAEVAALSGDAIAIDRSAITITVLGRDRAVEIEGCTPG